MNDPIPSIPPVQERQVLHFYFDFISPYGFFALHQIEALAAHHRRALCWHSFHLRAVTKDVLGMTQALADVPLKGAYVRNDVHRMARSLGVSLPPGSRRGLFQCDGQPDFLAGARAPYRSCREIRSRCLPQPARSGTIT